MKSKLEFKERDIEELKSKVRTDHSRNDMTQSAKRPRLSVVKETKPASKMFVRLCLLLLVNLGIRTFKQNSTVETITTCFIDVFSTISLVFSFESIKYYFSLLDHNILIWIEIDSNTKSI